MQTMALDFLLQFASMWEHRLIAAKKYGKEVIGKLVRHLNGEKADNRPENLVLGSHKENTMDHVSLRAEVARLQARVEELEKCKCR